MKPVEFFKNVCSLFYLNRYAQLKLYKDYQRISRVSLESRVNVLHKRSRLEHLETIILKSVKSIRNDS